MKNILGIKYLIVNFLVAMLAVQLLAVGAVQSSSEPTSLQELTPIERRIYQNHQQRSTAQDRATSPLPADPNRVVLTIPPSDTDPKIDKYVKDHYVIFNHAVRPNEILFLWLPGSYGRPSAIRWLESRLKWQVG